MLKGKAKFKAETQRAKSARSKTNKSVTPSKQKNAPKRKKRSKSQSPSKAPKGKQKKEDTQSVGALAFSAGDHIAFLDPESKDPKQFKIGLLISDVKQNDKQVFCVMVFR